MSRTVMVLLVALTIFSANVFTQKPTCDQENEEYRCGSACQTTCRNLDQPCLIVNIGCNDDCFCKEGYARNDNNICISIEDCPSI